MTDKGPAPTTAPLILTLVLDPASQRFFERERQRWFPPALNFIPAHVTLFHHLPGDDLTRVQADLAAACWVAPPAAFTVSGLRFLGRGVAYILQVPQVAAMRARLAAVWQADLTAQDRAPWRPHVTVQNKAKPSEARRLHDRLMQDFTPFDGRATGLALWWYRDGPWEPAGRFGFAGTTMRLRARSLESFRQPDPAATRCGPASPNS